MISTQIFSRYPGQFDRRQFSCGPVSVMVHKKRGSLLRGEADVGPGTAEYLCLYIRVFRALCPELWQQKTFFSADVFYKKGWMAWNRKYDILYIVHFFLNDECIRNKITVDYLGYPRNLWLKFIIADLLIYGLIVIFRDCADAKRFHNPDCLQR